MNAMTNRLVKTLLVLTFGFYAGLVAYNNIDDYGSNYQFVRHVLSMDTTFPGNGGLYRALRAPAVHQVAYLAIIVTELAIAATLLGAGLRMALSARDEAGTRYLPALNLAKIGLALAFVLWFTGFVSVGGEWLLMWQSATWNGVGTSYDIVTVVLLILAYVTLADDGYGTGR